MKPMGVPCFNPGMVEELHHTFTEVQRQKGQFFHENTLSPVDYFVIASRHPHTFNLGGDLALFITLIKALRPTCLDELCTTLC